MHHMRGGPIKARGLSVPFATWPGIGRYRYAICGGSFNLCVKKLAEPVNNLPHQLRC